MRLIMTTITIVCFAGVAFAQPADSILTDRSSKDVQLNELRTAPKPKQVDGLDTLQLASAHRERAASVDEKTNGLWQSWTTSICDGCGDAPPYKDIVRKDFINRKGIAGLKAEVGPGKQQQAEAQRAQPEPARRSLYTNLSTENIDQIRQMPGR